MMNVLVSMARAKQHLRVDNDDSDDDIRFKLCQAEDHVVSYLKKPIPAEWLVIAGSPAEPSTPFRISAAILIVLGVLYEEREGAVDPITPAVASLLARDRSPAYA